MNKEELLSSLKSISNHYFNKKEYVKSGTINIAIDVIVDFDGQIPKSENETKLLAEFCEHRQHDNCSCMGLYCKHGE